VKIVEIIVLERDYMIGWKNRVVSTPYILFEIWSHDSVDNLTTNQQSQVISNIQIASKKTV